MRREAKVARQQEENARIDGYHAGGYAQHKLFTSDRWVALDDRFMRENGAPYKGYGIEVETECYSALDSRQYARVLQKELLPLFPADLWKMERDASLSGGNSSAELITQIMTKEFIRNHYRDFKAMFDEVFAFWEVSAARSGNCGMHVNISNACFGNAKATQDLAIKKLYYIVNHHYTFCCSLFRRNSARTHYCSRMTCDKDYCKTMDLARQCNSHGISFNLGHYNEGQGRIELRLVGGQKNYASFRNTMECVFFLVDAVKRLSWDDVDDLSKVFKGCNTYVFDRLTLCAREGYISADDIETIRPTVEEVEFLR